MNELANQLRILRGHQRTQKEIADGAGISVRAYTRAELGDTPHMNTMKRIVDFFKPKSEDRIALWLAWIKLELGESLFIEMMSHVKGSSEPSVIASKPTKSKITHAIARLTTADQDEIIKAAGDPHVLACIRQLNAMRDHLAHKSRHR